MHAHFVALKLWHDRLQLAKLLACRMVATVAECARVAAAYRAVPCHAMSCSAIVLPALLYCVMDADTRHILIMTAGRGADERSVSQSVCLSACSVRLVCCSNPLA